MASGGDIRAGRAFVELFLKNNAFLRGMRDMRRQLSDAGKDIQAIGQKLAGMGVAIAMPLAISVKRFADFDDAMRMVGAVSEATGADLALMTEEAKRLGATTSFTAVEVANLMGELGKAGFSPKQVNEMTAAVLNLARASGTDATLSAGIMASTLRQFGMGAEHATRVADALTVAANASFNSVESLGESLSYAGPVAADFGMSIEDTLAILGGLGNVGILGSEAGTAMRRLLTLTGAEAEKLQGIFGVSFQDANKNARPLVDVLEEVNQATKDLGTGERAAKFSEAFGLLGITAASAIGRSAVSIRDLQAKLQNAGGTADATAKSMDSGLGGSFRKLLSAAEGVALAIGTALAPAIQNVAARATAIAGQIKAWVEANKQALVTAAQLAVGLVGAGGALIGVGMALQLVAAAIGGFVGLASALGTVLAAIASPIGLIVAGAAALAAGFVAVSGAGSYLSAQLGTLWQAIKGISQLLLGGEFGKAWEAAKLAMLAMGSAVLDLASQAPAFVGYALGRTTRAIVDGLGSLISWIGSTMGKLFTALVSEAAAFGPQLLRAMVTGDVSGLASGIGEALTLALGSSLNAFGEGWGKQGAPQFQASERTRQLRQQMAAAMRSGASPAAAAAAAAGTAAAGGPSGGSAGGGGSASQARPTIDTTYLEKYRERLTELVAARRQNVISEAEFRSGFAQLKNQLLGVRSPLQEFADRAQLLQAALRDGTLSFAEFRREIDAAKSGLVDATPLEKYTARIRELQELLAAGVITKEQFGLEAAEALPDKVKAIIENAKTPLEKFNAQIAEARDFFRQGLITREQFAAEQERLQKELRETQPQTAERSVSVSFSAAGLLALGSGGGPQDRMAEDVRKSAQAAEQQQQLAALQLAETQGLRQDLSQIMPFRWR
jgi:TP901 family phage tail tape measure protein